MSEQLNVENRAKTGSINAQRLRASGLVPANLYGHGQQPLNLQCKIDNVMSVIRHGARVVDLAGAVQDKAMIRELQWDTYGTTVLHIDMARVSADERVTVRVPVELKGVAAGASDGGVVEHIVHEIEIECAAIAIPDKVTLKIDILKLGGHLNADKIDLPAGATLVDDADLTIVHCVKPKEAAADAGAAGAEQPELIRKEKAAEDEE